MDFTSIFSKKQTWDYIFVLTYDFGPVQFFENEILHNIAIKRNMTIVIDGWKYREMITDRTFKPRFSGVYYNLERIFVRNGGRFHPKLYLLVSETQAELFIGSANLTASGFKANVENIVHLRFDGETWQDDEVALFRSVGDMLRDAFLNRNDLIEEVPEGLARLVNEILESRLFVEAAARRIPLNTQTSCYFFHSLVEPLFDQVLDVTGATISRAGVLSPFYDSDITAFQILHRVVNEGEICIPANKSTFPNQLMAEARNALERFKFCMVDRPDKRERFVHAKAYEFVNRETTWDFITSANFTGPGLFNAGYPRNFEIGVLFSSDDRQWVDGSGLTRTPITDFNMIAVADSEEKTDDERHEIDIESARYSDGHIVVEFSKHFADSKLLEPYEVQLLLDGAEEGRYSIRKEENKYYVDPVLEIEGNKLLQIQLLEKAGDYKGLPICVNRDKHDPNFLPSLGSSAYQQCLRIGGVAGLKKAIEYAIASGRKDWLLYLFSHWDLARIVQGIAGGATEETEGGNMPSLRSPKQIDDEQRRRQNFQIIPLLDMRENLKMFLGELEKVSRGNTEFARYYLEYCHPLLVDLTGWFSDLLKREEEKKKLNPSLMFPRYTWLHNYRKYEKYMLLIFDSFHQLLRVLRANGCSSGDQPYLDVLIAAESWIRLHTDKTINEFTSSNKEFEKFSTRIQSELNPMRNSAVPKGGIRPKLPP